MQRFLVFCYSVCVCDKLRKTLKYTICYGKIARKSFQCDMALIKEIALIPNVL